MKIKYISILLMLYLAAVFTLASCQPAQVTPVVETPEELPAPETSHTPTGVPSPTPEGVRGTITLWHSWEETQRPALLRRIAAFQAIYPDVQFDVLYIPSIDLRASFETAAAEGRSPAILIGPSEWGPQLYDQGLVADLTSLASPELIGSFNPAALVSAQYQGALIGVPSHIEGVVLYRNRQVISESPTTLDDLLILSGIATQGEQIGAYLDRSFLYSGAHLAGLGGQLMDANGDPAFNNEKGVAWIELLRSFSQAGPTDHFTENDLQMFKEGRVGFVIDGSWNRASLAEAIGAENLAIDPWPSHDNGNLSGFVRSENLYLSQAGSERLQEDGLALSWMFIEFLSSPESQSDIFAVGSIPAISVDHLPPVESDRILMDAMEALADGTAYPLAPDMPIYESALDLALKSVFEQGVPVGTALQSAEETILAARENAPDE